jgi:glycosyltransferase involved in cell wall biosynthesis
MKIVTTIKWADAKGGAERSGLDVASGLRKNGNDVTVLYGGGEDLLPAYRAAGCKVRKAHAFVVDPTRRLPTSIGLVRTTTAALRDWPDLVYCQDYQHLPFGGALSRATRAKLVCHLRLLPPATRSGRQIRIMIPRVDRFIAVSDDTRRRWGQAGLPVERIDVVHNGIDLSTFSPGSVEERQAARRSLGLCDDDYAIVYVGRIDHVKGVHVLVEAASRFATKLPNARLIVVGQPIWHESEQDGLNYIEELRRLAGDLRIDFAGPQYDLVPFYRAADVAVTPSTWPEPFGRVVIEAMACGAPVVASRIGGIPEILTGDLSDFMFPAGDSHALAARLDYVHSLDAAELSHRFRTEAEARFGFARALEGLVASIDHAVHHA